MTLSRNRLNLIILAIMLSLFLASMEGTVVATAMPTIVEQLGGLSIYSWVFSIYLLTSTTTVPIYGKLSDLYGRKPVYVMSMLLFLAGSILCGQAHTMEQLIAFRAVQGIGAGGVLPLAFTIVGELFTLEQRAKLQGLFSGVWGVSAVIGPLIGGFLVDKVSWQWVFYINIIPGLLAVILVWLIWKAGPQARVVKVVVDYPGAVLLTLCVLGLLLGLTELGTLFGWVCLVAAVVLMGAFVWVERHAADPILPFHLFKNRLFTVAILHGVLSGWAVFGSLNYVPLFVQSVLGTTATQAGITMTPMSLSWTLTSVVGGWLLLKMGYRTLALGGMAVLVAGTFFLSRIGVNVSQIWMMVYLSMMGVGMGISIPAFLIAVQSTVRREDLGAATSTLQFSRSIGGALGVSVLGAYLSSGLTRHMIAAGIDPASISLNQLLDPIAGAGSISLGPLKGALAVSIAEMFTIALVMGVLALLSVLAAPGGKISQLVKQRPAPDLPEMKPE
jgi:EmrB/QacA subfamily drug resistance transporter